MLTRPAINPAESATFGYFSMNLFTTGTPPEEPYTTTCFVVLYFAFARSMSSFNISTPASVFQP